ncbi:MAG: DUF2029 domain-containing protein [Armatimonadetes bacterium]|nr:DUF2029 domain-containing protein [Armatimonadota bacterium]
MDSLPPQPDSRSWFQWIGKYRAFLRYLLLTFSILNFCYTVFLISDWDCGSGEAFHYWAASRRVYKDEKLYRPWPDYGPHYLTDEKYNYEGDRFPYPPPMAAVLSQFSTESFPFFKRWWTYVLFTAFWVYAACLSFLFYRRLTLEGMLHAGLILSLTPGSLLTFFTGIADPLLWALFGLALATRWTGVALITSAWIKIYAGWPYLFALFREGKRIAWQGIFTLAAGFAIGLYYCGLQTFIDWATYFLPVVGQGTFSESNYSLSMAGLRLFRLLGWEYTIGPLPLWARGWLFSVELLVPLAVGYLTRKKCPKFQYACVGVAAAACAPLCWITYFPLLLLPLVLYARQVWDAWEERIDLLAPVDVHDERLADSPEPVLA